MAAPAGAGDAPKRLVLKLARTGGDQWAVAPGAAPPAASPAAASAAEVKSEPKEEKNGRLIIRLKAPAQRKAAESDSEGEGDGARRADGGPEAKRQRKPSAIALAAGGALSGAPRVSQREAKAPARQDDTSSHRDDEEDDEIEVSSMSHGGDKNRPQSTVMIPLRKAMSSLVAHLIKKDFYGIFYEPVDPEEVHDYYEVIKKPMCFKTIRKKLADDLYPSLKSLEEDVDLICANAMTYNPAGSVYHEEARKLLAESKSKFVDYAPRTVSTLPPKKARDHGRKSASGADGADPLARALGPGGLPLAPGAPGASPSVARLPGTPLAAAAAGASRPMSGAASSGLANASSGVAASPLAPPAGRRYAAPTMPPQRRPQPAINAAVLPAAGVAPGTSDAKATFAYNPAVPGKPATASPYASTTQNYVNAPTRPGMMRGPLPVAATTMEEQQYQASVEAFVKGTQSAEAAAQVSALLTRLKNPPPAAPGSATLAEVLADVRSHPHTEPPQMADITAVVDATRDIPGVDLAFLLRVLPARSPAFAVSGAAAAAAAAAGEAAEAGADKEVQRELDRNYESLVRLQQLHHQRPAVSPAAPAPAEAALSHALSLSLALLSSKLPLEALHPVSAAVPSLTHNAAAAAAAANGTEAKHEPNAAAASSGTPSPPAPQPMAMETS